MRTKLKVGGFVLSTAIVGAASVGFAVPAHASVVRVVDDDGRATATNCNATVAAETSIQAALDLSTVTDVVKVCPGIYTENVTVPAGVALRGPKATTDARTRTPGAAEAYLEPVSPATPTVSLNGDNAQVAGFVIRNNSGNAGVYTSPAYDGYVVSFNILNNNVIGAYVNADAGALTTVVKNRFLANNLVGPGNGNGIYTDQNLQNASIDQNKFEGHENAGVLLAATPATINDDIAVTRNTFLNNASDVNVFGATDLAVTGNSMTGGALSTGSQVRLTGASRVTVSGNRLKDAGFAAIALRSDLPLTDVSVTRNIITSPAAYGVDVTTAGNFLIQQNSVRSSAGDGIRLDASTSGVTVDRNSASGSTTFDCHDESTGGGTAGTANTWVANRGKKDSPEGICV